MTYISLVPQSNNFKHALYFQVLDTTVQFMHNLYEVILIYIISKNGLMFVTREVQPTYEFSTTIIYSTHRFEVS
jgi:hypothetical protein